MIITIVLIVILVFSAVLHEYAHGWTAKKLGDDTADREGRLTLNPLKHLDPIGSVLFPIICALTIHYTGKGFFLAWAKPIPYNPNNLSDRKFGELKVAIAGPVTNFIIALFFGLVVRFIPLAATTKFQLIGVLLGNTDSLSLVSGSIMASFTVLAMLICFINLMLGIFNLIPVPPLDGSKVLAALLPYKAQQWLYQIERYGFIILLLLIMSNAFNFVFYVVLRLFSLITGLG